VVKRFFAWIVQDGCRIRCHLRLGDDKQNKNNVILYYIPIPNLYNILLHIDRLCIVIVCVLHNSDSKGIYYFILCVNSFGGLRVYNNSQYIIYVTTTGFKFSYIMYK